MNFILSMFMLFNMNDLSFGFDGIAFISSSLDIDSYLFCLFVILYYLMISFFLKDCHLV